jgi:hypothetical protein
MEQMMKSMVQKYRFIYVGSALAALVAGIIATAAPANAVVYCRAVGVPRGCVARAPVAAAPAMHGPVVYCKRVGYPKGCVAR